MGGGRAEEGGTEKGRLKSEEEEEEDPPARLFKTRFLAGKSTHVIEIYMYFFKKQYFPVLYPKKFLNIFSNKETGVALIVEFRSPLRHEYGRTS